jgi:template-activating factor I
MSSQRFDKNEWFENDVLFKEFHMTDEGASTVCSKIKWKPGKNLISSNAEPSEDHPSSFFVWFTEDDPEDELANVIREEIWPDPLRYFNVSDEDDEQGSEENGEEGEADEEGGEEAAEEDA